MRLYADGSKPCHGFIDYPDWSITRRSSGLPEEADVEVPFVAE
jgi:hypothetical protein